MTRRFRGLVFVALLAPGRRLGVRPGRGDRRYDGDGQAGADTWQLVRVRGVRRAVKNLEG